jgi:hypothetical protein
MEEEGVTSRGTKTTEEKRRTTESVHRKNE